MELYIFDQTRKMAGIVDAYEYLRWTRRYSSCGSFELKAIANENNITLLQLGSILWKSDDEEAGMIEFLELIMQEQEYITVTGRFATGFLARRIIWGMETLRGDLSTGVAQLLNNHLIAPNDTARKIDGILFTPQSLGKRIDTQISYRNLLEVVTSLCEASDIGIKTVFAPATGVFNIILYTGSDSLAVFSKEYENIIEQVYTVSKAGYATTALVGGEGEGAERTFVTTDAGGSPADNTGEERYEIFVDAKDLRSEDFPDDYSEALTFRGDSKLHEQALVQAFDVTINQYGNLEYKRDYDIGSSIRVVSQKWGVSISARITEIEESYGRDGMSLNVTFGKPLLSLAQRLKDGGI